MNIEIFQEADAIDAKNTFVTMGDVVHIILCNGTFVALDEADFRRVAHLRWSPDGNGYAQTRLCHQGKITNPRLHRYLIGEDADGWFIDHVNGRRWDCRRANLRICSQRENVLNRARNVANKFGYKGVRQHKSGYFFVQIKQFGKCHRTGQYDTAEEAGRAYDFVAKKWFGAFARLNFPDDQPNGGVVGRAFPDGAAVPPAYISALMRNRA